MDWEIPVRTTAVRGGGTRSEGGRLVPPFIQGLEAHHDHTCAHQLKETTERYGLVTFPNRFYFLRGK
jgi:hypothetical protein